MQSRIRSLGHDAPLAALNPERKNLADYMKESVAVVTNPAIDRDRETEHFSTRVIIGKRPSLLVHEEVSEIIEFSSPLLIEGKQGNDVSDELQQPSYDQLVYHYEKKQLTAVIDTVCKAEESIEEALERLSEEAIAKVRSGKSLIILDDAAAHLDDYWLDPHLVISVIDQALVKESLRRDCSLVLRSAASNTLDEL